MNVTVTGKGGMTVASAPRVTLDLNIEEFTLIEYLRWHGLSGRGPLRTEFERAFKDALAQINEISPMWAQKVERTGHSIGRHRQAQEISKSIRGRR